MTDDRYQTLRDLAAAYVLDALEPDEMREFEAALRDSEELQREVAALRETTGLLAASAPGVLRDDEALKARLRDRIKEGDHENRRPTAFRRPSRTLWIGWAAAAILAIVAGLQAVRVQSAGQRTTAMQDSTTALLAALADRDATLAQLLNANVRLIHLTTTGDQPPGIQMFWNATSRRVVLYATNLPPAPAGEEYQLWFLRDGGVEPGATFNTTANGEALITLDGPPENIAVLGGAVTREPVGGSLTPTMPIIVSGSLGAE